MTDCASVFKKTGKK